MNNVPTTIDGCVRDGGLRRIVTIRRSVVHLCGHSVTRCGPDGGLCVRRVFGLVPPRLGTGGGHFVLGHLGRRTGFSEIRGDFL